jgi:hypothetical protein
MALSFRQDWQLRGIERRLRKSEPKLAAMFEGLVKNGPALCQNFVHERSGARGTRC